MKDHTSCSCNHSTGPDGASVDRIALLDSRAAVRAAWIVHTIRGSLPSQDGLANNIHELRQSSTYERKTAGFIHNVEEMRSWAGQKSNLEQHPLGRLSADALEEFFSGVRFADYVKDGQRYQHISEFYYGDLRKTHGFSHLDLFNVFARFKISSEYAVDTYDSRPSGTLGARTCIDWPGYSCPW